MKRMSLAKFGRIVARVMDTLPEAFYAFLNNVVVDERVLEKLDDFKIPSPVEMQSLRTVQVLEHLATPEAKDLLKKPAEGAEGARLTKEAKASLERLSRRTLNAEPHRIGQEFPPRGYDGED